MYIDSHAHLFFEQFQNDLPEVLERAKSVGVKRIINIACGLESAIRVVEMAKKNNAMKTGAMLKATVGLHPYESGDFSVAAMEELRQLAKGNSEIVVAVGETGLDYFKADVPKDVQLKSFKAHLELGNELSLPVVVHNREADEDCLRLIDEVPGVRCVFHCYASSLEYARKLWERGHFTSFSGIITYPNAGSLLDVVREAPIDQIMIETDCPYLAPQNNRGKRNEPSFVVEVAEKIAEVKGIDLEELEKVLQSNTEEFFSL